MNGRFQFALVFVALCACGSGAIAQTVYRCGDSYSQQPCAGGTVLQPDDARSEAQRKQTDAAAQRDAKAGDALEKARLKEEARPTSAYLSQPRPDATMPDRKPVMAKPKKPEYFTAIAPAKPGDKAATKKKKARKKVPV